MRAGKRSNLITIEKPVTTKGKYNNNVVEWVTFNKVWAKIEQLRWGEKNSAAGTWPSATHKITLRYIQGLLPTMRVVYEGVIYSILNVNDIELQHKDIELICETGVKGA